MESIILAILALVFLLLIIRRINRKKERLLRKEELDEGEWLEAKDQDDPLNFYLLIKKLPSVMISEEDRILWKNFLQEAERIIEDEKDLINLIKTFYYFKYLTRGNVLAVLNMASTKVQERIDKILDGYKPIPITSELVCYYSWYTKNKNKIKTYILECIQLLKNNSDLEEFQRCYELLWNRLSFVDSFVRVIDTKVNNTDDVNELLDYLNIFVGVPLSGQHSVKSVINLLDKIDGKIEEKTHNYDIINTPFSVREEIKAYKKWLWVWPYPHATYIE